jgi:hypothetical protein
MNAVMTIIIIMTIITITTDFSTFSLCPSNTVLLLGAPMLPTWWVNISTYLQSERFLFIVFYNLVLKLLIIFKALVLNPYVHVLCSF